MVNNDGNKVTFQSLRKKLHDWETEGRLEVTHKDYTYKITVKDVNVSKEEREAFLELMDSVSSVTEKDRGKVLDGNDPDLWDTVPCCSAYDDLHGDLEMSITGSQDGKLWVDMLLGRARTPHTGGNDTCPVRFLSFDGLKFAD